MLQGGNAIRKLEGSEFENIDCKIGGPLSTDVFDPADYPTSLGYRINSLASALASMTLTDSQLNFKALTESDLRRTGILIANQYGVQEVGEEAGKLRLIKQMNHVICA